MLYEKQYFMSEAEVEAQSNDISGALFAELSEVLKTGETPRCAGITIISLSGTTFIEV